MAAGKIAFAGTADIAARILEGLVDSHEVSLVISQPDRPAGRGRKLTPPPLARYATEHGFELIQPERIDSPETLAMLRDMQIDTIVVVAFGQLIREPVLSEFLLLNVHVSALPYYRGAAPIERAIMDGNTETGISIMQLEAGMDTGPVARIVSIPIGPNDTAGDIYEAAIAAGIPALSAVLDESADGSVTFTAQDHEKATHAAKITAEDRELRPGEMTAQQVHDTVRGLAPHIGAFMHVDGKRLGVWETRMAGHPVDAGSIQIEDDRVLVGCADGAGIELRTVQPAGKKQMDAVAWAHGLQQKPRRATAQAQ